MVLAVLEGVAIVVLFVNFSHVTAANERVLRAGLHEAQVRRHENCRLFVGNWQQDVRNIDQTSDFLKHPRGRDPALVRLATRNAPQLIVRARINTPPTYCHVSGREKRQATASVARLQRVGQVRAPAAGDR